MLSEAKEEAITQKGCMQIADTGLPRDVTPKAGTRPSISVLPCPVALYLDKGVSSVCSLCNVQGPGDVFSTDGDRVFDQAFSESLELHLGREQAASFTCGATSLPA